MCDNTLGWASLPDINGIGQALINDPTFITSIEIGLQVFPRRTAFVSPSFTTAPPLFPTIEQAIAWMTALVPSPSLITPAGIIVYPGTYYSPVFMTLEPEIQSRIKKSAEKHASSLRLLATRFKGKSGKNGRALLDAKIKMGLCDESGKKIVPEFRALMPLAVPIVLPAYINMTAAVTGSVVLTQDLTLDNTATPISVQTSVTISNMLLLNNAIDLTFSSNINAAATFYLLNCICELNGITINGGGQSTQALISNCFGQAGPLALNNFAGSFGLLISTLDFDSITAASGPTVNAGDSANIHISASDVYVLNDATFTWTAGTAQLKVLVYNSGFNCQAVNTASSGLNLSGANALMTFVNSALYTAPPIAVTNVTNNAILRLCHSESSLSSRITSLDNTGSVDRNVYTFQYTNMFVIPGTLVQIPFPIQFSASAVDVNAVVTIANTIPSALNYVVVSTNVFMIPPNSHVNVVIYDLAGGTGSIGITFDVLLTCNINWAT